MRKFIEVVFSVAVAIFALLLLSKWIFLSIPLEWIYILDTHFNLMGIEEEEDMMVLISLGVSVIPSLIICWLARKAVKRL